MRYKINLFLLAVLTAMIAGIASNAAADTVETRSYVDLQYTAVSKDAFVISVEPFYKMENRFRDTGLVYTQWNAGIRSNILSWLSAAVYYTPRELAYPNKTNSFKNAAGADLIFKAAAGPVGFMNREANEYQITDNFYRYRNLTEVKLATFEKWPSIYISDEFRADSDQQRINMNNAEAGFEIPGPAGLVFRLLYDVETNRRLLSDWQYTQYAGISCGVKL